MTALRLPYYELSADVYKGFLQAHQGLENGPLDNRIIELVYLRISQINGCAFCLEMHGKALRTAGIEQEKLDALAGWRVSSRFSPAEAAALAWAEDLTHVAERHAEDAVYGPLKTYFSDREISDLTFAISLMNAFNRLAIGMRM